MQPHIIVLLLTALLMVGFATIHSPQIQIRMSKTHFTGSTLKLSPMSKRQLDEFLHGTDGLMGVSISRVNLVFNTHSMIYYASDNPEIRNLLGKVHPKQYAFITEAIGTNTAIDSNTEMLEIINGDISCQAFPGGEICHIAIPIAIDRSGDFVGYITIFIKRNLSIVEKRKIIQHTKQLAGDIYTRDVLHPYDVSVQPVEVRDE